ncbi:tRNA-splicing ligase RtcB [Desulfitispora alkaliphila]|uniref:RtcB family protein n=1 Tax=Desulfitispora alkaliphila TaxID=622674 RepID=UPI003D1F0205
MFVLNSKNSLQNPIKVWLDHLDELDDECLKQAKNVANLKIAHGWLALMPDVHTGYGMPIGGVLATKGAIIPNAVGVDIGCGVNFMQTNIPLNILNDKTRKKIAQDIHDAIPVGFKHHKKTQKSIVLNNAHEDKGFMSTPLSEEIKRGYYQVGTLGGGNHFIEIQKDERDQVGIMVHTGSRNFGFQVCKYFNNLAVEKCKKKGTTVNNDLAYLEETDSEFSEYIAWMNLAMNFAAENRSVIMKKIRNIIFQAVKHCIKEEDISVSNEISCHHNFASKECHQGTELWIHRKGAIRVEAGDKGIIPGSMGAYSYIVRGLGSIDSFNSCSHGAGRKYSRKKAKKEFNPAKVLEDMKASDVMIGKFQQSTLAEECRFAYKDIEDVIRKQKDLIKTIKRLKTVIVVKG